MLIQYPTISGSVQLSKINSAANEQNLKQLKLSNVSQAVNFIKSIQPTFFLIFGLISHNYATKTIPKNIILNKKYLGLIFNALNQNIDLLISNFNNLNQMNIQEYFKILIKYFEILCIYDENTDEIIIDTENTNVNILFKITVL